MPLIRIWNFDSGRSPMSVPIPKFFFDLGRACMSVEELGIKDGNDTLISIEGQAICAEPSPEKPAPILIIVDLLYEKPGRTLEVKQRLAKALGQAAKRHADPGQPVEVFVRTFDPKTEACWLSSD